MSCESFGDRNSCDIINATNYGVSVDNSGAENSENLQELIDSLEGSGRTVYIPAGEYKFAARGTQTIGSHCIKMRSGVSIIGDGDKTVLMPVGTSEYGLDMFYFNDYLDTGAEVYLENCRFESFVIDAYATSVETYTSAGKGFMFNLFRDCHWKNVTVKNTDATGFGVDCPIDSSISGCKAIGCGKGATEQSSGASGFGIGFGFCDGESISVSGCEASGNKRFGFFFEHQGRFDSDKYSAFDEHSFTVSDSVASGNLYNFGGIRASDVIYRDCRSFESRMHGFYFENSGFLSVEQCTSLNEGNASFAVSLLDATSVCGIRFSDCTAERSPIGIFLDGGTEMLVDSLIDNCTFISVDNYMLCTSDSE
ncbi:MAG: hypothetical protein IJW03_02010 [Clostridia bacterium]|nr:hypothetical protein [Clostridia bacterium]